MRGTYLTRTRPISKPTGLTPEKFPLPYLFVILIATLKNFKVFVMVTTFCHTT